MKADFLKTDSIIESQLWIITPPLFVILTSLNGLIVFFLLSAFCSQSTDVNFLELLVIVSFFSFSWS